MPETASQYIQQIDTYLSSTHKTGVSLSASIEILRFLQYAATETDKHQNIAHEQLSKLVLKLQKLLKHLSSSFQYHESKSKQISDRMNIFKELMNFNTRKKAKMLEQALNTKIVTNFGLCVIGPCLQILKMKQWEEIIDYLTKRQSENQKNKIFLLKGLQITPKYYALLKLLSIFFTISNNNHKRLSQIIALVVNSIFFNPNKKLLVKEAEEIIQLNFALLQNQQFCIVGLILQIFIEKFVRQFVVKYQSKGDLEEWVLDGKISGKLLNKLLELRENKVEFEEVSFDEDNTFLGQSEQDFKNRTCNYCGAHMKMYDKSRQYILTTGSNAYSILQCEYCLQTKASSIQKMYYLMTYPHQLNSISQSSILSQIAHLNFFQSLYNLKQKPKCPPQTNSELIFAHNRLIQTIINLSLSLQKYIPKIIAVLIIASNSQNSKTRIKLLKIIKEVVQNHEKQLFRDEQDARKIRMCIQNRCSDVDQAVRCVALQIYLGISKCDCQKVYQIIQGLWEYGIDPKDLLDICEKLGTNLTEAVQEIVSENFIQQKLHEKISMNLTLIAALSRAHVNADRKQENISKNKKKKPNSFTKFSKRSKQILSNSLEAIFQKKLGKIILDTLNSPFPSAHETHLTPPSHLQNNKKILLNPIQIFDALISLIIHQFPQQIILIQKLSETIAIPCSNREIIKMRQIWARNIDFRQELWQRKVPFKIVRVILQKQRSQEEGKEKMEHILNYLQLLACLIHQTDDSLLNSRIKQIDMDDRQLLSQLWKYVTSQFLDYSQYSQNQIELILQRINIIGQVLVSIDRILRNKEPTEKLCEAYLSYILKEPQTCLHVQDLQYKSPQTHKQIIIKTLIGITLYLHPRKASQILNPLHDHLIHLKFTLDNLQNLCLIWQALPSNFEFNISKLVIQQVSNSSSYQQTHQVLHCLYQIFYLHLIRKNIGLRELELIKAHFMKILNYLEELAVYEYLRCEYFYFCLREMLKTGLITYITAKKYIISGLVRSQKQHEIEQQEQGRKIQICQSIIDESTDDIMNCKQIFTNFSESLKFVINSQAQASQFYLQLTNPARNSDQWLTKHDRANKSLAPSIFKYCCDQIVMFGASNKLQTLIKTQFVDQELTLESQKILLINRSIQRINKCSFFQLKQLGTILYTLINNCFRDIILHLKKMTKFQKCLSQGKNFSLGITILQSLFCNLKYLLQGQSYQDFNKQKAQETEVVKLQGNHQRCSMISEIQFSSAEELIEQFQRMHDQILFGEEEEISEQTEQKYNKIGTKAKVKKQKQNKAKKTKKILRRSNSSENLAFDSNTLEQTRQSQEVSEYCQKLRNRNKTKIQLK